MKIYCMSDIHACLESFEAALENVICHLDEDDTMLLLLGDYVLYIHHHHSGSILY